MSSITYKIVIPIKRMQQHSGAEKGRRFETLWAQFLKQQSYTVIERFRDAGTEIDLLCEHNISRDVIVVECKAKEDVLKSEVVNKLLADVIERDAKQGWIFSISNLGQEARTRLEKLVAKGTILRFFAAKELVHFLVDACALERPNFDDIPHKSSEQLLCLCDARRIWAVTVLNERRDTAVGHLAWDAETGTPLSPTEAPDIIDTDFPHADLGWLPHARLHTAHNAASQAIVEVIPGDEWSDYRPSRPTDFVGRINLIADLSNFLTCIKDEKTPSRLFGVRGRSGWGKSSLAIKIAHELSNSGIFVLPVDCRAANSASYPDLAVGRALSRASKHLLGGSLFSPRPDFRSNPFEEPSVADFLNNVRRIKALVVLIFDQFEAIIHRNELRSTFDRMRELALFVDEMRGPFAVGFSWKTDGTVSADNPGYHLWHSLSDRRRDFEIDRFTREDADQFITLAVKSASIQLPKSVVQFILEQYAGYPWLLKKLIRHCVDEMRKTGSPSKMASFFNISSLFDAEIQELNASESAAIRFIGKESPIELHIAEDKCGANAISSLIDRRLITKTGNQISLYWDVFRDYVLHKQIPQIPTTYIPTVSVRKIRSVVRIITSPNPISSYSELAHALGITLATADNAVRDLANIGLVAAERIQQVFEPLCKTQEEATKRFSDFLRSHAVYIRAKQLIECGEEASVNNIQEAIKEDYAFLSIDEKTLRLYVRKMLFYCVEFGILQKDTSGLNVGVAVANIVDAPKRGTPLLDNEVFRGAAPPGRVVDLIAALQRGECQTFALAAQQKLRNAVFAATSLGLIERRDSIIRIALDIPANVKIEQIVARAAEEREPIRSVRLALDVSSMTGDEVGAYVSDLHELNWALTSCRRYGSSIKEWCNWIEKQLAPGRCKLPKASADGSSE